MLLSGSRSLGAAFVAGKVVQFALPLVAWWRWPPSGPGRVDRARHAPMAASVLLAVGFAAAAAAALAIVYRAVGSGGMLAGAAAEFRAKLTPLGLATPAGFVAVAVFYSLCHSGLEEYYWRWFVDRRLVEMVRPVPALVVSSLGFMAHHVILIARLVDDPSLVAAASLAVAAGGALWAWLYRRSRRLRWSWLSHGLVDAALMAVGWDLLFGGSR